MSDLNLLLAEINRLVKDQHFSKVESLAEILSKNITSQPEAGHFNSKSANQRWKTIYQEHVRLGLSREFLAGLLLGAASGFKAERDSEQVDLVWSGPDVNMVPVRRSEQVLVELINSAKETLHLISYVLVNVKEVESAIKAAIERGVDVSLLIESISKDGSGSFGATVERLYRDIKGLKIFTWPLSNRDSYVGFCSMHGKSFVADSKIAFITSANLTSAALDRNIEIGVLVNGGLLPSKLVKQFESMKLAQVIARHDI